MRDEKETRLRHGCQIKLKLSADRIVGRRHLITMYFISLFDQTEFCVFSKDFDKMERCLSQ
jgi:hypothetical protein